jgi:hypothetical protein
LQDMFPGHYRPSDADFHRIWLEGLVVLDANVLLNLYRYSDHTRQELLRILREIKDSLWLPRQAADEYLSSRLDVIHQQRKKYEVFRKKLDAIKEEIGENTEGLHRDSVVEADDLLDEVRESLGKLAGYLEEKANGFAKESNTPDEDETWRNVDEIFTDKLGEAYTPEQEKEIVEKGQKRYAAQTPPGYKDQDKGGERQFGDLFLWFQILDKAKEIKRPIVFITDDRKDDWWWKSHGKTVGPRPELVNEIGREAGVSFYMYQPFRFMEEARGRLGLDVSDEAINEAQALDSIEEEAEKEAYESAIADDLAFSAAFEEATASETAAPIRRVVGRRVTEIPRWRVTEIPRWRVTEIPRAPRWEGAGVQEAQEFLNSPAVRQAQEFLNSPAARQAQEFLNSPAARQAQEFLNSPEARQAQRLLNSPEVREALKRIGG